MLHHLLADVVCQTFMKEAGKFQAQQERPRAMVVTVNIDTREGEEGYRSRDLLLFAPMNYVRVFERERWDVIPEEDLDEKTEEPKPGKGYRKGESAWTKIGDHDSAWRDAVSRFFYLHRDEISTWGGPGGTFYRVVFAEEWLGPEATK
jgi:hypothetical protein